MKKILYLSLVLGAFLIVWFCLTKQRPLNVELPSVVIQQQPLPKTNSMEVVLNAATIEPAPQPTNTMEPISMIANALTATNLEQWKAAIRDLHPLAGFKLKQDWMMEKTNRLDGAPVMLQLNGNTVSFSARLIDITAKNETGDIIKVEMHSPIMNIYETRELGLQLCKMLGHDPADFLAWCDKVGNHWLDTPTYDGFSLPVPNSNKFCGFGTLHTYTDEKPWYILFFITSP